MVDAKNIVIVAGEASGDLHGANLVREILRLDPDIGFFGIGGDLMKDAGVNISHHVRDMAVVGFFEVINKFPLIRRAMRDMEDLLNSVKPDAVILIDYPGFNLRLARRAKALGIKVIYYISPQIWAWHKSRMDTIKEVVDKMLVVFPFEVPIYKTAGVDVEFVGHPLMDAVPLSMVRDSVRTGLGFESFDTVIGILPGSRKREVESLLPEMLKASKLLAKKISNLKLAIPVAPTLDPGYIEDMVRGMDLDVRVFKGRAYDVMAASDVILIASGTATLEAAIVGTPMVITYRVSPVTYWLGKMLVNIEFIGLPNIVAGKGIIPELIQGDATAARMADETLKMLSNKEYLEDIKNGLKRVRQALGGPGASGRAAERLYKTLIYQ